MWLPKDGKPVCAQRFHTMNDRLIVFVSALLASNLSGLQAKDAEPLGLVENFDSVSAGPYQTGFIDIHRWSEDFRRQARSWSRIEIVPDEAGQALRVNVGNPRVFTSGAGLILRLAPYFPPQADALRFRLKVLTGRISLFCGGPTAYYGNSDVFTEPQTFEAAAKPEWIEVVLNFNRPTWRNFRRSGFSTDAPRNYYNRWAQEPLGIVLAPDSLGECLIDDIEVISLGEGRPFATFRPDQITLVKPIADFEDGKQDEVFTLYMAAAETEWFDESWIRSKALRFEPMRLAVTEAGLEGRQALECRGRTAEEVHCAGLHTRGAAEANAISVNLLVDTPGQRNTLVGAGAIAPLDFLVFVAPAGKAFDWSALAPSPGLKAHGGPGFDYNLTHRSIAARTDLDFAIYQTRRYLTPGEWSRQVLPAADFTCIYGQGSMRDRFLNHEALQCGEVIAIAWLHPWCRLGKRDAIVTTRIDELSFVQVPGTPDELRSFWQVPDVKAIGSREEDRDGQRLRHVWLEGDDPGQSGE